MVQLTLSISSNIVASIISHFIQYTRGIEESIKIVLYSKNKIFYYRNIKKLILFMKIKFILFFICQIIIIGICLYYIVIFCIIYSRSQKSLIINYCYSLIESIIIALGIIIIILITRKVGLSFHNKWLYNISKYINSNL